MSKIHNLNKLEILLFLLGAIFIGTSCNQSVFTTPIGVDIKTNIATYPKIIRTSEVSSTITPEPINPVNNLPSSAPPSISIPMITQRCMNFLDISYATLKGRLVISGYPKAQLAPNKDNRSYLVDLQSGDKVYIGHTEFETVSPNGEWLAFYDLDKEVVAITNYNGDREVEIPSPEQEQTPVYWLDNQRLVINKRLTSMIGFVDSSLVVLNPFTKEQYEWLPEFPNQDNQYLYDWQVSSNLIINPELSQIIYPNSSDGRPLSLMDLSANQIIQNLFYGNPNNAPRWSFGGDSYITSAPVATLDNQNKYINIDDGLPYKGGMDLLLVESNGDIKRLTYFSVNEHSEVERYTWSLDDHMIAFLKLDTLHSDIPELNVLNIYDNEIINYCETTRLPADPRKINTYVWPPDPVWSPDNRFLAITFLDREDGYSAYIIELSNGNTWQIAKNGSARGWMIKP